MSIDTQNNTTEAVDWYRANEVYPAQIGFDPDGMCQKICRTARNILPGAPSALASALSTPTKYRVPKIADLRKGMVLYFDDPNDSNPYGHIVTQVGRVAGADPDSLSSILVRTNSVVSNRIVVVRADFFGKEWGDSFQFGAWWLNGEPFYDLAPKPEKPATRVRKPRVEAAIDNYTETIRLLRKSAASERAKAEKAKSPAEKAAHNRLARALMRDIDRTVKLRDDLREQYRKYLAR